MLHQTVLSTKGWPIRMIRIICKQKIVLHISLQNPINPDGPDDLDQIIDKKLSYQTMLFAISRPIWMIWIKYFFLGCPFCNRPVHPDDLEK